MLDFRMRSKLPELMDDPSLSEDHLALALKDIAVVNRWLGGNKITLKAIDNLLNELVLILFKH